MRKLFWLGCAILATWVGFGQGQPEERWWRGNLHTHSFWSDGDEFPEMVADWYREHGYHFLTLSDHNVQSQGERWELISDLNKVAGVDAVARYRARFGDGWVESRGGKVRLKTFDETRSRVDERDRFLMIPSEEITGKAGDGRDLHMNGTNLIEQLPVEVGATLAETLLRNLLAVKASAKRTGRPVMFHANHPNYKWGVKAEDLAAVAELQFVEIWNGVDNDNDPGDSTHPSTEAMWDAANAMRMDRGLQPLYGLGVDDAHDHQVNKTRAKPGRAWVQVKSRYLEAGALIGAMQRGDFYFSSGVEVGDIAFDSKKKEIRLRIEGGAGEQFVTRFVGVRRGSREGVSFGEVAGRAPSYVMKGDELYVRAVVTSSLVPEVPSKEFGYRRAWTQPVGWK
ncbi:MAG: hypothetical protein NTW74_13285 [Acidobacteria bacterium]|nr:hypothetical protein [Acidobacteriota bacterium]